MSSVFMRNGTYPIMFKGTLYDSFHGVSTSSTIGYQQMFPWGINVEYHCLSAIVSKGYKHFLHYLELDFLQITYDPPLVFVPISKCLCLHKPARLTSVFLLDNDLTFSSLGSIVIKTILFDSFFNGISAFESYSTPKTFLKIRYGII